MSATGNVGWGELRGVGNLVRLTIVCLGVWLHAADGLLVATMLPDIVADIGGVPFVSWTFALYEVGSVAAGASGAILAMRYGLRRAMTGSALVYAGGCAMSALAPTMPVMLIGRLAQGLGGGGLLALSLVAVSLLFSRALMPRVLAAISALWGISAFIGPLIGGVFADLDLWRGGFWVFAAQALLLAAMIAPARALDARREQPADARLPLVRLGVLALGVLAIAAAGIALSPVASPALILVGLALLGFFLRQDARRKGSRLLPRAPLDPRNGVGAALLMVLAFSAATVPLGIYGPLLLTRLHDISALTAGYVVAASAIGWSVMAIVVAGAPEKRDGALILAGMLLTLLSIAGFAIAIPFGPVWSAFIVAVVEGAGFGIAWTFILRRATALAPEGEVERVSAAIPTVQRIGYALGAAYIGIVANAAGMAGAASPASVRGVGIAIFSACLPLGAIGFFAAWRFVRFRPQSGRM